MKLLFFCPRWGSEALDWKTFITNARNQGYDGVEFGIPSDTHERELDGIFNLLEAQQMYAIPQHYDTVTANFALHEEQYCQWFEKIMSYKALKINSQTGRDVFIAAQNTLLFEHAAQYAAAMHTTVCHETHRGKFSFAAHITKDYLSVLPQLALTLDISHWVCVAESYLDDQSDAVELAIARTSHLHARVGHTQGSQVFDPRAPEWEEALSKHLVWWDAVGARYAQINQALTITPEFGAYPYTLYRPYSNEPLANQWEVNAYMMELLKDRYANK